MFQCYTYCVKFLNTKEQLWKNDIDFIIFFFLRYVSIIFRQRILIDAPFKWRFLRAVMLIDPLDMSCYVWSFNKGKILHQEKPSNKLNSNHDEESTWQSIRNSHFFQIRFQRKKYQTTTITTNDDLRDNPDLINQIEVLLIPPFSL